MRRPKYSKRFLQKHDALAVKYYYIVGVVERIATNYTRDRGITSPDIYGAGLIAYMQAIDSICLNGSNATFVQTCKTSQYSVVLFDDDYTLKSALQCLKKLKLDDKILIATKSWQYKETLPKLSPKTWILFGKCADFASSNSTSPVILIKPSSYQKIYKNTNISQIYLPTWDPKYNKLKKEFRNWKEM